MLLGERWCSPWSPWPWSPRWLLTWAARPPTPRGELNSCYRPPDRPPQPVGPGTWVADCLASSPAALRPGWRRCCRPSFSSFCSSIPYPSSNHSIPFFHSIHSISFPLIRPPPPPGCLSWLAAFVHLRTPSISVPLRSLSFNRLACPLPPSPPTQPTPHRALDRVIAPLLPPSGATRPVRGPGPGQGPHQPRRVPPAMEETGCSSCLRRRAGRSGGTAAGSLQWQQARGPRPHRPWPMSASRPAQVAARRLPRRSARGRPACARCPSAKPPRPSALSWRSRGRPRDDLGAAWTMRPHPGQKGAGHLARPRRLPAPGSSSVLEVGAVVSARTVVKIDRASSSRASAWREDTTAIVEADDPRWPAGSA